jgi:hypothetical protein
VADWDVVGAAPAQVQNPWAVRSMAPAPSPVEAATKKVGGAETTEGPLGFVNGLAELVGKGLGNMPLAAVHGIADIASRATGHGPSSVASGTTFPLSPNAQSVGQGVGESLSAAAEPYRVKGAEPFLGENVAPVLSDVAAVAPAVGAARGVMGAVRSALPGEAAATPASAIGLRTSENAPIARSIAGPSGREALNLQNQQIGNTVAGAQAGVPHGTDLGYDTLEQARGAPNAVYGRVAQNLPTAPLSPTAAQAIQGAGGANRITQGTPDAITNIQALKDQLLAPGRSFTGDQVVNESRGLRQEGGTNIASDDVSKQQLGRAQLDMARGLEQHIADSLPTNGTTSLDQFQGARTALAKNYAVQSALRGPHVDLQALARVQRGDPGLLTDDMKTLADFANDHPEVSTLPSAGTRYAPPGLGKDLGQVNIINPRSWVQPLLGSAARRSLTGNPAEAAAAARSAPVTGLGGEFNPLEPQPPQPPPGLTASTPTAPPPAAPGPPGQISLADLLSHGVEQQPAPGLSSGPMGAPPPSGIPFTRNAAHEAGGLSLADELGAGGPFKGQPMSMADFAGVKSQGVPEGIMTRTPAKPKFQAGDILKPDFANNASGESAASLEAQSRLGQEKAAGVKPVIFGDSGVTPLLHDVTTVDRAPPKGHIILDANSGKVINGGGLKSSAVQALLNRWNAMKLGEAF